MLQWTQFLVFLTTLGAESLTWNFISLPEWLESRSYICLIVSLIVFYWFLKKKIFFGIFFCHYLVIYFVDFYWLSNFDETHVQEYLMVYYINKNVRSKFVMVNFRDKIETKLQSEPLHFPTNLYFLSRTLWFWPKNMMEGCKMELFPFFKKKVVLMHCFILKDNVNMYYYVIGICVFLDILIDPFHPPVIFSEAVAQNLSVKKVFLKISENS